MILFIICKLWQSLLGGGVNISVKCDSSSWCNAHGAVKGIQNENLEKFLTRRRTNCHINSENMGRNKFGILGISLITKGILDIDFPAEKRVTKICLTYQVFAIFKIKI